MLCVVAWTSIGSPTPTYHVTSAICTTSTTEPKYCWFPGTYRKFVQVSIVTTVITKTSYFNRKPFCFRYEFDNNDIRQSTFMRSDNPNQIWIHIRLGLSDLMNVDCRISFLSPHLKSHGFFYYLKSWFKCALYDRAIWIWVFLALG